MIGFLCIFCTCVCVCVLARCSCVINNSGKNIEISPITSGYAITGRSSTLPSYSIICMLCRYTNATIINTIYIELFVFFISISIACCFYLLLFIRNKKREDTNYTEYSSVGNAKTKMDSINVAAFLSNSWLHMIWRSALIFFYLLLCKAHAI